MPSPLGTCQHKPPGAEYPCGGDLCVSSEGIDADGRVASETKQQPVRFMKVVRCEECGIPVPNHPALAGENKPQPPPVDVTKIVKREDFPRSLEERLKTLEDGLKMQAAKIAALQAKLAGGRRMVEAG